MKPAAPKPRPTLPSLPRWAQPALQGLAFWIGHRRALYSDHPLAEAALVAELCNLIHAHLPRKERQLRCEVQYSELKVKSAVMGPFARMDLLISARPTPQNDQFTPLIAIEVKRYSAPTKLIDADLQRLAAVKLARPEMRAFLVVVAEASHPKDYVSSDGDAIVKSQPVPNTDFIFRVRRVLKASPSFSTDQIDNAQFVCLIEVLPKPPPKPPRPPKGGTTFRLIKKPVPR
jgi:hypothetical protein